jgi:hypothetical protein
MPLQRVHDETRFTAKLTPKKKAPEPELEVTAEDLLEALENEADDADDG